MMLQERMNTGRLFFDGGMGTLLQKAGLKPGEKPEEWSLSHPEAVLAIHKAYVQAGADILTANTFGINRDKYPDYKQMIAASLTLARTAAEEKPGVLVAADIGPTGRMTEPLGDLSLEEAVSLFADNVKAARDAGADLILIETMNDSLETKAAVIAAKENCDLPVFVTNAYDPSGRLMTGADPAAMVAMLEGLRVDALGINCSAGPEAMLPVVSELLKYASVPVIVNPNAGLPTVQNGETVYDTDADSFAATMARIAGMGASVLGGCCGTEPETIRKTVAACRHIPFCRPEPKSDTMVSSYTHAVRIGEKPVLIGERINPTGKKKLKEALQNRDFNYIVTEGLRQAEKGAQVLDVNVGLPGMDEEEMMGESVKRLQAVCDLPLQLDSSSPKVLEKAMRLYNGKPLVNSVNGKQAEMAAVFPLIQKYGGTVIALTLDEAGIPDCPEQRLQIARKIAETAKQYGVEKKDIVVDPLALTVSSDPKSALITLETLRLLKADGFKTSLGVSNISFGLPCREKLNAVFFANALANGLDCAIMNPFSTAMTDAFHAFCALHDLDTGFTDYIRYAAQQPDALPDTGTPADLKGAIIKGLADTAAAQAEKELLQTNPLAVIEEKIIPALNEIGAAFEQKKAYLPQLLMSADAACAAFAKVKEKIPPSEENQKGKVILATVKGDIHDIGKNIVKVLLASYGFTVIDLGRDVEPQKVLDAARRENCRLVGLSALMTTTVPAMEETIRLLHREDPSIRVIVGGAVLTRDYAESIGADAYAPDAMTTVRYAEQFYQLSP